MSGLSQGKQSHFHYHHPIILRNGSESDEYSLRWNLDLPDILIRLKPCRRRIDISEVCLFIYSVRRNHYFSLVLTTLNSSLHSSQCTCAPTADQHPSRHVLVGLLVGLLVGGPAKVPLHQSSAIQCLFSKTILMQINFSSLLM